MTTTKQQTEMDFTNSPTYWFACYRKAVASGDQQAQDESQRELDRLGYVVEFRNGKHHKRRAGQ